MTTRTRPVAALVVALVVLTSVLAGAGMVGAQSDTGSANDTNADANATNVPASTNPNDTGVDLSPADDIYLRDNGDAVLAYRSAANDTRANYGLNVSEGLFHALVATHTNESDDLAADLTATLKNRSFTGNGTLSAPRPDSISNLSANLTGRRTHENARYDATLAATLTGENTTLPLETMGATGNLTVTASDFEAGIDAHARLPNATDSPQHQSYQITEDEGSYTLDASEEHAVSGFAASQWASRQQAKRTLTRQYAGLARGLGGTADLTLDSYAFTDSANGTSRLDVEYTVTYIGIERVLTNRLTTVLATTEAADLNRSEIRTISRNLRNFSINDLSVGYDRHGHSFDATMHADLHNYDDVVLASLDVADSINTSALDAGALGGSGLDTGGVTMVSADASSTDVGSAGESSTDVGSAGVSSTDVGSAGVSSADSSGTGIGIPSQTKAAGAGSIGGGRVGADSESARAVGSETTTNPMGANFNKSLQQFRDRFEAQQAANLTRHYTFSANVTQQTGGELTIDADSHYRTHNWAQYAQQLRDRNISQSDVQYSIRAATDGERLNLTAAVSLSDADLLDGLSKQLLDTSSTGAGAVTGTARDPTMDRSRNYLEAFREAGFQKGRMDLSLHDGRVRMEAGAAFANMTALRDVFVTAGGGQRMQSIVGRTEDDSLRSYVRVSNAVPANASRSRVRALAYVDDDTAIHQPGSWNRTFPATNTSRAQNYLGLTPSTASQIGPGFGIAVAVIALLAVGFVAVRWRH